MNIVLGLTLLVLIAPSLCIPMDSDKTDRLDTDVSLRENRTAREITCRGEQYPHSGFCCLNCPAGTYVKKKCTTAGSSGQCAACTPGTDYTEHSSGLERCLQCTRCRSDQEEAVPCTPSQNRVCQCKSGTHYCLPEEPCEVCKRCSKCPEGKEVRTNCNATANTVCGTKDSPPAGTESDSSSSIIALAVVLPLTVVVLAVIGFILRRKRSNENRGKLPVLQDIPSTSSPIEMQNHHNNNESQMQESTHLMQAERSPETAGQDSDDCGLGGSLSNTATSSQNSLSSVPYHSTPPQRGSPPSDRASLASAATLEDSSELYSLTPLQDNALMDCLDEFYKVPIKSRIRFMRKVGLHNNKIDRAQANHPGNVEEQFHEMLLTWHEERGQAADINILLRALLNLDHRLTVETIIEEVVKNQFYTKSDVHLL
ncbi:tumor necrosis factor receptor superfamily member 10B-like [Acipenser oxyrinchus oxyrinchus]|uniref:Tumor necrosis factor receptor superfamily member 10B-like n=1 Tax=Acipenser oxyrinchus oxyrinchus TaxID=40147 RepID=A0AAD8FR62_ACIOX|nr:tumor necrosis factor receptor superfamily member 10B-like [Acipenser oxyrinchus oxyrinchus]